MSKLIYNSPKVEMIEIQALSCLMGSGPDPENPGDTKPGDFGAPGRRDIFI